MGLCPFLVDLGRLVTFVRSLSRTEKPRTVLKDNPRLLTAKMPDVKDKAPDLCRSPCPIWASSWIPKYCGVETKHPPGACLSS